MTILVLVQRKVFSSVRIRDLCLGIEDYFARANRGGSLTHFCAAVVVLGIIAYVSMLIMTFDFGLRLREAVLQSDRQSEELKRLEVLERLREAEFSVRHREILEKMDKISTLKYLEPEGAVVSRIRDGVWQ